MLAPANKTYTLPASGPLCVGQSAPVSGSSAMALRPEPGMLKSVHTNSLTSVNVCPGDACWYSSGGSKQSGPWANWCGGVFASGFSSLGAVLYQGGGHLAYDGAEIYAFDLSVCKWVLIGTNPATDIKASLDPNWCDYENPPGSGNFWTPATHTYGNVVYVTPALAGNSKGSWLLTFINFGESGISGSQQPHAIDLATGLQSRFTTNHLNTGADGYGCAFVDTTRNIVWGTTGKDTNLHYKIDLNVAAGSRTAIPVSSFYTGGWNFTARYVPSKDMTIVMWCDYGTTTVKLAVLDLATGTPVKLDSAGVMAAHTMRGPGFGFDYCPDTGKFYCYNGFGETTLHVLTPPTDWRSTTAPWVWSTEEMGGETPVALTEIMVSGGGDGPYSKWLYHPSIKCFMWSQGRATRASPDGTVRDGAFQLYRPLGT